MIKYLKSFYIWFFESGDAIVAASLRIGYGILFLYILWDLYPSLDLVLGHSGLFGTIHQKPTIGYNPLFILYIFDTPIPLRIWFWLTVAICLFTIFGLFSRLSSLLLFLSALLLYFRNPFMVYGADSVFIVSFFWVLFLKSGHRVSLDKIIRGKNNSWSKDIPLWPVKVIQIQIALTYFLAGLAKIHNNDWLHGTAVYYALNYKPFVWKGALQIAQHKTFTLFLNYFSILAEISFPFLVFRKNLRWVAIGGVFIMHLGIDIFMNIRFFALTMYVGLLSFVKPLEWDWVSKQGKLLLSGQLLKKRTGNA